MPQPLKVFEHEFLEIGTGDFQERHWKALGAFNQKNGDKFLTLYPDGVKFKQYVGVIQAGNLTIEVLPKADKPGNHKKQEEKERIKWHRALLQMLRECQLLKVEHPDLAQLQLQHHSTLEIYLSLFLEELQRLMHEGLIKKYRKEDGNQSALKGQLLFSKQLSRNLVHKERFYVRHTVYDKDHLVHQVLFQALKLVKRLSGSPLVKGRADRLLLDFPDVKEIKVTADTFSQVGVDQKTARYRQSLLIARMLLLNYQPDIAGGNDHVLALLFDMNRLWEEYVYRQLVRLHPSWDISRQDEIGFWQPAGGSIKSLRPDIVINSHSQGRVVIDTKWKIIEDSCPADSDLQQMFAYAHYNDARLLILVYPSDRKECSRGTYVKKQWINGLESHVSCILLKVPLRWDGEKLDGLDLPPGFFSEEEFVPYVQLQLS
ncbi:hypothetical protein V9K67_25065 [Paraflavisolibacter sp. H34]|uniref:McrC family protein n=1 Tax=Huijunlia imazamoxiresistens TaxID=3127457 RepID=UPI0030177638